MSSTRDQRGNFKYVDPKDELKDYSGPFKPDLRYSDFSKEQLVKLYVMANDYFIQTVLPFILHTKENYGIDAMYDAMDFVWVKWLTPHLKRIMSEGLNIPCNDIESLMKTLQLVLDWGTATAEISFEMPSKDHGIITCHRCLANDMYELGAIEDVEILKKFCHLDVVTTEAWAAEYNPDIVCNPLALSPRNSKDDPACKWELTYKSK